MAPAPGLRTVRPPAGEFRPPALCALGRTRVSCGHRSLRRMFESLSERLGGVFDRLRGRGALNEADVRAACARCASRCSRPTSRCPWCATSSTRSPNGDRPVGAALDHAGPAGRQDRQRRAGRDAGLGSLRSRARRHAARDRDDGRPARLGQDDDDRQDRQAAARARPQEGAARLARRQSPGRAGAARGARRAGRGRDAADRRGPAARRHRAARPERGQAAGLRRADARYRRAPARRPGADGRDEGGRRRHPAAAKSCSSSMR